MSFFAVCEACAEGLCANDKCLTVPPAKLLGEEVAKTSQLALEYDPAPPFDAGTPTKAGEKITKNVQDWVGPLSGKFAETCEAAAKEYEQIHSEDVAQSG